MPLLSLPSLLLLPLQLLEDRPQNPLPGLVTEIAAVRLPPVLADCRFGVGCAGSLTSLSFSVFKSSAFSESSTILSLSSPSLSSTSLSSSSSSAKSLSVSSIAPGLVPGGKIYCSLLSRNCWEIKKENGLEETLMMGRIHLTDCKGSV